MNELLEGSSMPATVRAFFAVTLPPALQKEIAKNMSKLKKEPLYRNIKWVKAKNLHITLRFLGQTTKEKLVEISQSVLPILENVKSFTLQFTEVIPFPKADFPIALVLRPNPTEELTALALAIDTLVIKHGLPIERRAFNPHLTLARIKHKLPGKCVIEKFPIKLSPMNLYVNSVKLMRSEPTPLGSSYSEIDIFYLQKIV